MITSKTLLTGLLGHPVGHSKSPLMHNAAMKQEGLDMVYLAFDVEPCNVKKAIEGLKALNYSGVNVTIPHKESVMEHLDGLSEEAKYIGAVNTIINRNGKLIGDNTDGRGFMQSLKNESFDVVDKKVLLIGAGGAAKAVATKLLLEGVSSIGISEIDKTKGMQLVDHLNSLGKGRKALFVEELKKNAIESNLIINCTPVGMKESDPLLLTEKEMNSEQLVFDLIYNPSKTKLLQEAEKKGAKILNGLGMLVYQGALSFEMWTGVYPDTDIMFKAIKGE